MQVANCYVIIGHKNSNVPRIKVTPAELVLLVDQWKDKAGRHPVHNLEVVGEVKRTNETERARLRAMYGKPPGAKKDDPYKIDRLYPGVNPQYPKTFEETGLLEASKQNMHDIVQPDISDRPEEELIEYEKKLEAEELTPVGT